MRKVLVLATVTALATATAALAVVQPWRVVARGTGTGSYAIANVSASVDKPNALAVRSLSGPAEVTWSMICSGKTKAAAGRVYVLTIAASEDCNVSALASGDGRVTVQILKK